MKWMTAAGVRGGVRTWFMWCSSTWGVPPPWGATKSSTVVAPLLWMKRRKYDGVSPRAEPSSACSGRATLVRVGCCAFDCGSNDANSHCAHVMCAVGWWLLAV